MKLCKWWTNQYKWQSKCDQPCINNKKKTKKKLANNPRSTLVTGKTERYLMYRRRPRVIRWNTWSPVSRPVWTGTNRSNHWTVPTQPRPTTRTDNPCHGKHTNPSNGKLYLVIFLWRPRPDSVPQLLETQEIISITKRNTQHSLAWLGQLFQCLKRISLLGRTVVSESYNTSINRIVSKQKKTDGSILE